MGDRLILSDHPTISWWLLASICLHATMEWGTSHHPGKTDITAVLAAPLPWNDRAAGKQVAWMLQAGADW